MKKPKIGLLALYLSLYNQTSPNERVNIESFYNQIRIELDKRGLDVISYDICCIKDQFKNAVEYFEKSCVDAIVTLHLAYSPSLEAIDALKATKLPLIILDTTPDFEFDSLQSQKKIAGNHGIHGVQDLCNMLIRVGKSFKIAAGHWKYSDVLDNVKGWAQAVCMCNVMRASRIGRIGSPFSGMGDFLVEKDELAAKLGVTTVICEPDFIKTYIDMVADSEVDEEIKKDKDRFITDGIDNALYKRAIKVGLGVKKWIEDECLTGFTFNFLNVTKASGFDSAPFLEAGKLLSEGYGYAGEGDVLTASLVGTLACFYPEVTFTEMFCPDWKGNTIFISHMGEMNVKLASKPPVLKEKPFPFTDAYNPIFPTGCYKRGNATLVNLAPGAGGTFKLVVVPVNMLTPEGEDKLQNTVHGWFSVPMEISWFLERYSEIGGTHHSALVYGDAEEEIVKFGRLMGWEVSVIN